MDTRRYFIFILACLLCLGLVSCGSGTEAAETESTNYRFKETYFEYDGDAFTRIFVDTETGVMYFYVKTGYGGGLTVMVDKDGKPLTWGGVEADEH